MTGSPTARTEAPASAEIPAHVVHAAPANLTVRGTVVVLPGRGENAAVYARLATRLTVDAYRVVVVDGAVAAAAVAALVHELAGEGPAPLVLLGSDTGAVTAHELAARDDLPITGAVLAGLPPAGPASAVTTAAAADDWAGELDARTACPVHRARLDGDPAIVRGAVLRLPVEDWAARRPAVPALVLHGASDVVSPLHLLRPHLRGAFDRIVVVENGRHDVLNDLHHRSVAAEVVQFLEALRRDPLARPALTEVTP